MSIGRIPNPNHNNPTTGGDAIALQSEYRCARCNANCPTKSHLVRHMSVIHDILQHIAQKRKFNYECPICRAEFAELKIFNGHLLVHPKQKFCCSICHKMYSTCSGLNRHSLMKHGVKAPDNYKCENCGGMFKTLNGLSLHSVLHKPPQFNCNQCGLKFFRLSGLLHHTKYIHMGEKKKSIPTRMAAFECPQCSLKLSTATTLKQHLLNIHQPKDHKCSHCYKEFSKAIELSNHLLKAHSLDVKPVFKCTICQRVCTDQRNFLKHSRFHGNPTHSCSQCSLKFYSSSQLADHVKRFHSVGYARQAKNIHSKISYSCAICCRPFGLRKSVLRKHLQIHYSKLQICPVCQEFHTGNGLESHMRQTHPDSRKTIHCDICNKGFVSQEGYQMHRTYHDKPTMACPDCSQCFYSRVSLISHSNVHCLSKSRRLNISTGTSRFGCAICSRMYVRNSKRILRRHIDTHYHSAIFCCSKCHFQCSAKNTLRKHLYHFHTS